jgi:DNA-binding NarL/FixJ family response regulator
LIVDGQSSFAEAIAHVLEDTREVEPPRVEVVGVASTGAAAVDLARRLSPDVILTEFRLPDVGGASYLTRLCASSPRARVLVLASVGEARHAATALRFGASGFLAKTSSLVEIVEGVRAVGKGEIVVARELLTDAISGLRSETMPPLTQRELQVVQLMAEGLTTARIAARLDVRPNTARNHLQRAFEKLGVHSRVEAVMRAQSLGLVAIPA